MPSKSGKDAPKLAPIFATKVLKKRRFVLIHWHRKCNHKRFFLVNFLGCVMLSCCKATSRDYVGHGTNVLATERFSHFTISNVGYYGKKRVAQTS